MNRSKMLQSLKQTPLWDAIIIGGGATGLGIAVDSATRGFKTLLLEAHDFAKGTSSRSTKLIHGGVRYLEQGDIPLVLEALHERGILHQNAPHLVHHLSFIVPRYKWWEGPFFGIGLKVYDALAGKLNLARSRMLSREETIKRIPNIETNNLLGGVEYFDGQFDDARLAITLALTAISYGATLLNYFPVMGLKHQDGMISGVVASDSIHGGEFNLQAKVIINATGIFTDQIRLMDDPQAAETVQPSQGVHLVFAKEFLRGSSAIMVPHTDDGRVLFVIPWHDHVLVGTTDTPMQEPEIDPRPLDEEIDFILRNAAKYLAAPPSRKDILSTFAGQRPLVRPPQAKGLTTKAISRHHEIFVSDTGLVTIAGGKWTTYRKMAEDTVDQAILIGGLSDQPCKTASLPLYGQENKDLNSSLPNILKAYGTDLTKIEDLIRQDPSLGERLHPSLPYTHAMAIWAIRHEMAQTVEDVLSRRTRCLLLNAHAAMECAPLIAELLAKELGKSAQWQTQQVDQFIALVKDDIIDPLKHEE